MRAVRTGSWWNTLGPSRVRKSRSRMVSVFREGSMGKSFRQDRRPAAQVEAEPVGEDVKFRAADRQVLARAALQGVVEGHAAEVHDRHRAAADHGELRAA